MKVNGSAVLHAPRERVWRRCRTRRAGATIPGCQQLEQVGPDSVLGDGHGRRGVDQGHVLR
jgi:carbon monoxide dehydrogenase subunit G